MGSNYHVPFGKRSTDELIRELDGITDYAGVIFSRLQQIVDISPGARVLDVGASVGRFVVAANRLGYNCEGLEPFDLSRRKARELAKRLDQPIKIASGDAESLPYENRTFHVVVANSVMEHVPELPKALAEIHRVLKPGGVFWFSSASSLCPRQGEIRKFPCFGWYPNPVKIRIMNWAKERKPHLVGYADKPAVNWFTPWKAARMLRRIGFTEVFDRWDLRCENEGGPVYQILLRAIRSSRITKIIADMVLPCCSYAAIKPNADGH